MSVEKRIALAEPDEVRPTSPGDRMLAFLEVFLLSLWLGSMIFFSAAVAPSAFAVLPTHELAGALVTSTISKIEVFGLVIGPLLILIQLATWGRVRSSNRTKSFKVILIVIMLAAAAFSRFWVSPAMVSLRAQMNGHIDDVPATDPLRIQFNSLHHYSVWLMSAAIVCGILMQFQIVRSWLRR